MKWGIVRRSALVVLLLAAPALGCGRLGFEPASRDSGAEMADGAVADAFPIDSRSGGELVLVRVGERAGADIADVTRDTTIEGETPAMNYGTRDMFRVDMNPEELGLLYFDLSTVSETAQIETAELVLVSGANPSNGPMGVFEMLESWDEMTATFEQRSTGVPWTSAGAGTGSRGDSPLTTFSSPIDDTEYAADLPASLVRRWVSNPETNFGVAIVALGADGGNYGSKERSTAGLRPELRLFVRE